MLTGQSPFHGNDEDELFYAIQNSTPRYSLDISINATDSIKLFLERDPTKRLGMKTCPYGSIRDQAFFKEVNWDRVENRQIEAPYRPYVVSDSTLNHPHPSSLIHVFIFFIVFKFRYIKF